MAAPIIAPATVPRGGDQDTEDQDNRKQGSRAEPDERDRHGDGRPGAAVEPEENRIAADAAQDGRRTGRADEQAGGRERDGASGIEEPGCEIARRVEPRAPHQALHRVRD